MTICHANLRTGLVLEGLESSPNNYSPHPNQPLAILLVDDDPGVRDVMSCFLRRDGHRVQCACDGEEGWNALCAGDYDGMITDHNMPQLSGLDLIRRMRDVPCHLPVILISGRPTWDETEIAGLLRPGLALSKPFAFVDLQALVRRIFVRNDKIKPQLKRPASVSPHSPAI